MSGASAHRIFFGPPSVIPASLPILALALLAQGQTALQGSEAYTDLIRPVFQQNCVACHGPEKSKAGLRLDSIEAILKGGEDGVVIVPGRPAESRLLKRVRLPISHEDHMPPDGKPQPSQDDIALLEWWIENGTPTNRPVEQLKSSPAIARILANRSGTTAPSPELVPPKPLDQVLPLANKLAGELNVVLGAISASEPWLQCNASIAGTNFGDSDLARLAPLAANLRWMDLAGTGVHDDGLALLAQMPNLTRLHLEKTAITDAGLRHLSDLSRLEYLNLHHTAITDAGLGALQTVDQLRQIYVWETGVTPQAAEAFADAHTDKAQIEKWQEEIRRLNDRIRLARFVVDTGSIPPAPPGTNALAANAVCPVSGKPADPSKTVNRDGKVIAFCCADCRTKFQQEPAVYLQKLELLTSKEAKPQASK